MPRQTPSYTELSKELGISIARISQLKTEGMPVHSAKAAQLWRNGREAKRQATNAKKTANLQSFEDEGRGRGRPQNKKRPSRTGDSLQDALNNAIAVANGAFDDYEHARVNRLPTRSMRLSEHNKALDQRFKAEKAYREEQERRDLLVLKTDITDKCRRGLETVLRRINKLPGEQGPQCNPGDALMAVTVLQRACDEIKKAVQEAMAGID